MSFKINYLLFTKKNIFFTTVVGGFGCTEVVGGCFDSSFGGDVLSLVFGGAISLDGWGDRVGPLKKMNQEIAICIFKDE